MNRFRVLAGIAVLALSAPPLAAADGDLDPTFWGDGKAMLGGTGSFGISAVVVAPDNRVVVVGTHDPGDGIWEWYWRALGDSSANPGCYFSPPGAGSLGDASAAAFDSAGRLLVAGWGGLLGAEQMAVARFSYPDCILDDAFDGDGYWTLNIEGGTEVVTAIAIDSASGQIALAGDFDNGVHFDWVVALLGGDGALVDSFSENGWRTFNRNVGGQIDDRAAGVVFDGAGNVIVAGTTYYAAPDANWSFARFVPSGALDSTFGGGDGEDGVSFNLGGPGARDDVLFGLARDPNNGNLLLVGDAQTDDGYALAISRRRPTGAHDPTFSIDGEFVLSFPNAHARLEDVAVDGLGRTLVAGFLDYSTGDSDVVALRFNVNGTLDESFGYFGMSLIAFDFGPEPHQDDYGRALAIQAGRVVVAGDIEASADQDYLPGLARLENALIFADGFESGGSGQWPGGL